jgi:type IV pilus assembly protein PilA
MYSSFVQRLDSVRFRRGSEGVEAGFTLIELMVVLVILAILLAIAIPTFLSVGVSAHDRAGQANLNTAVVGAKEAFVSNGQSYVAAPALVLALQSAEPSLSYQDGGALTPASAQNTISVATASDGGGVVLAVLAQQTGNCWYIVDNATSESDSASAPWSSGSIPTAPGTYYGEWKNVAGATPPVVCDAATAPTGSNFLFESSGGFPSL